jgi:hypothetical protein
MPPNSALVPDACASALRAFYSAPQRGRYALKKENMKLLVVLLIVCASLAGCDQKEDGMRLGYYAEGQAPASEADRSRNKYLAYEHSVSVDTNEDGAKSLYERVIATCKADAENGCTVLDSSLTTGRNVSAKIRIRTKPEGIKNIVGILSSAGQLINHETHVEDLARPIVDNNKRLEMLKRYQRKLMQLEREATHDVDSLIKISKELATVQSEIEQAAGESAHLLARVNMDILNVDIRTQINRSFWSPVRNALSDFTGNLSSAISSVVVGLAYILPWAIVIFAVIAIGRKVWRRRKA